MQLRCAANPRMQSQFSALVSLRFRKSGCSSTTDHLRRALLLFLILSGQAFGAGLTPYAQLVIVDTIAKSRDGIRVTYLGTNGYEFELKDHALLVDPYFSRVDLSSVALGSRIQPDISRIDEGMRHLRPKLDAILVTHGHFDHLLDVPILMSKTHTRLLASASSVDVAKRAGALWGEPVTAGNVRRIGPWTIRVLAATHTRLFDRSKRTTHLRRFRRNTWAVAAKHARGSRHPGHGPSRFACAIARRSATSEAGLHSAEPSGRFLFATETGISIWAAHRFSAGATRVRTRKSRAFDSARLFSIMDTAAAINPKSKGS